MYVLQLCEISWCYVYHTVYCVQDTGQHYTSTLYICNCWHPECSVLLPAGLAMVLTTQDFRHILSGRSIGSGSGITSAHCTQVDMPTHMDRRLLTQFYASLVSPQSHVACCDGTRWLSHEDKDKP